MPILLLIIPLFACTADVAPGSIRAGNVTQQHFLMLKSAAIERVAFETTHKGGIL